MLFKYDAKALVDGLPEDVSGADAARTCIYTMMVYVVTLAFCSSQVVMHR